MRLSNIVNYIVTRENHPRVLNSANSISCRFLILQCEEYWTEQEARFDTLQHFIDAGHPVRSPQTTRSVSVKRHNSFACLSCYVAVSV